MGCHREPSNFQTLSPFQAEMRRRLWSTIYQMDMSISIQLGMPRTIKDSISDTLEPRNLFDMDFDPRSNILPASRNEHELTPTLMLISKSRIMSILGNVSDLITNPRPHSYEEILNIDAKLNSVHDNLPEPCKYKSLSLSIMDSPRLICQVSLL